MSEASVIDRAGFDELLATLVRRGYSLIGPTVGDGAIVNAPIETADDLPAGVGDEQEGGTYRLRERGDDALFGHNAGPDSWKSHLFPPTLRMWRARRGEDGSFEVQDSSQAPPRQAFIGVRSCDLHAIAVQDKVFKDGAYVDRDYEARRDNAFVVAVNCGQAASTCFCASMDTGPLATTGYDISLTELLGDGGHRFVAQAGSEAGEEVLGELPRSEAAEADLAGARAEVERAAAQQTRSLETDGIKELLYRNLEHPRWEEVSDRCLSCGNCTMVCPTCFCSDVEDVTDLAGDEAERVRVWDSCFTLDHSYVHGGSVRRSTKARYRQWMTHKLATWIDQFGTSGCVGCGRCIAWCPVAIDITEEAAAIRSTDGAEGWSVRTIDQLMTEVPAFAGLTADRLELIAGCGENRSFEAGHMLMRAGEPADTFYVIRHGSVALETFVPQRGPLVIETLDDGDLLGWSWLFPPYKTEFDARAVGVVRTVAFDGGCLRGKCDEDPALGYELMKRFAEVITERLQATRLRLLDVYGHVAGG